MEAIVGHPVTGVPLIRRLSMCQRRRQNLWKVVPQANLRRMMCFGFRDVGGISTNDTCGVRAFGHLVTITGCGYRTTMFMAFPAAVMFPVIGITVGSIEALCMHQRTSITSLMRVPVVSIRPVSSSMWLGHLVIFGSARNTVTTTSVITTTSDTSAVGIGLGTVTTDLIGENTIHCMFTTVGNWGEIVSTSIDIFDIVMIITVATLMTGQTVFIETMGVVSVITYVTQKTPLSVRVGNVSNWRVARQRTIGGGRGHSGRRIFVKRCVVTLAKLVLISWYVEHDGTREPPVVVMISPELTETELETAIEILGCSWKIGLERSIETLGCS